MPLEDTFDTTLIAGLANREKQIQQTYRPVIGIHKWFARRPGTLFRGLLLSEFVDEPLTTSFFSGHQLDGKVIADPFMGGGTPLIEANRLGIRVIGSDINPMAYWTVRQTLAALDQGLFEREAERVAARVEDEVGCFYKTRCLECGCEADVKYFLWIKQFDCKKCGKLHDAFPGYLVAKNERHTAFVWYCPACDRLAEVPTPPSMEHPTPCPHCGIALPTGNAVRRGRFICNHCGNDGSYPDPDTPPHHRLFGMEYHCTHCRSRHAGRYFKAPDHDDLARVEAACCRLDADMLASIPEDEIPPGDETDRLHRWGYRRYRELFNKRQLVGLHAVMRAIRDVADSETRFALATVFSDFLRYQNMLCRYDTMALKCQDIFSIHGFPVGLVQCENNVLGIPGVGGGGFRHFVSKYLRAKEYCRAPYEVTAAGSRKRQVFTRDETIVANFVESPVAIPTRAAYIVAGDSRALDVEPDSLDGVFTDPPYFDNVQYAELMDFCYVWLRQLLNGDVPAFSKRTTRHQQELTGNATLARGIEDFTEGLSAVFQRMAVGLKPGAPLAFTYHHNNAEAYVPIIVAILDARLVCTATLSCPAEMAASLHINGTGSSIVDTVFVCRKSPHPSESASPFPECLVADIGAISRAGVPVTTGDVTCMALGHFSRLVIGDLLPSWDPSLAIGKRMALARHTLNRWLSEFPLKQFVDLAGKHQPSSREVKHPCLFPSS